MTQLLFVRHLDFSLIVTNSLRNIFSGKGLGTEKYVDWTPGEGLADPAILVSEKTEKLFLH